ncbi:pyruvate carboxylase [Pontibacillus halophilus JSM 076056 = DSM 19796]|uniref:Pyruvate carboxylase n=1 Tax=Pontibacillus halophilus JSM 076056 = DSM 19796 TaxID=1385510 RepID=A0A0A5GPX3_9BACI|nr:pyruvate carboxylase [Pontibacillus halophilus]KGX93303.1 pyruvate carboxylase [Pontibacillus halophilus JSM 076056 = DSM 19796]
MGEVTSIRKMLVANRGEIAIRVFRACTELDIRTVAIYSKEDVGSYHRYKADEAYLVGEGKKPIDAYLDIEGIIDIAKSVGVDAIHPGYGFLSENIHFARRCEEEGLIFVGPTSEHLDMFGDKVKARTQAIQAGIPVIPGSDGPVGSIEEVQAFARTYGYPIMVKASLGGGGRGMRIVRDENALQDSYDRAKSEAKAAFGNDELYVEKLVEKPKHIEVQILGDADGNIVHLYERDCSVQRRHQKVVEVAPSVSLPTQLREEICNAAVKLMNNVRYLNAGTVEFLVTDEEFFFIEVNPRVQVEHTITELITGIDIVQAQIMIAEGHNLHASPISIPHQDDLRTNGYAIQSRVTTEDPLNQFMPDTGKIMAYRSGGGFGVRLDAGNGFQGAVISPYYDSLLVKVSTWALTFEQAAHKMVRNLREFRIRGIKTNIPFLENVVLHKQFLNGSYDTTFIDQTPELFVFPKRKDRGTKMLNYIADTTVNGFKGTTKKKKPIVNPARSPVGDRGGVSTSRNPKQLLDEEGPEAVAAWLKQQKEVLYTDTTFRDAHQSLLATRIRTRDLESIAEPTASLLPNLFSLEMWGGATFDVAYRFLKEDPWERLLKLREKMPNMLFQMLLRSSNAVGYKNYPDNVIQEFVTQSSQAGIDVFRIFDSLNWVEGMKHTIHAVRENGKIAEASMCYTGDILDRNRSKYNLEYYKQLAKELQQAGAHVLGIKDMAGLLKPESAYQLVRTLKESIDIPIHLHTHDTSGNGIFTYARAIEAGVDAVDVAVGTMAGLTSQPSASSLYYALEGNDRKPNIDVQAYEELGHYWQDVRRYYEDFESGILSPHTEVYEHEMPGGQYSNLQQQAKAVGLGERWDEVKNMYRRVNDLFGDIVKVTPSSKVVGDMALFMVQNDLTEQDIYEKGEGIRFPDSVIELFQGYLGQPYQGFPEQLQKIILKGREAITVRPGELYEDVDFSQLKEELFHKLDRQVTDFDVISYALYPKVFMDYHSFYEQYGNMSVLDTLTFFYGMRLGESIEVEIEQGKTLIVKLVSLGEPQVDGTRVVYFELNGQSREVVVRDQSIQTSVKERPKMDASNPSHIGATMPGTVVNVLTESGEQVKKGDHLMITEAMKMETTVQAPFDGVVSQVHVANGDAIKVGDLLIEVSSN